MWEQAQKIILSHKSKGQIWQNITNTLKKCFLLLCLSEFFFYPLLGRARFQGRCWAAIKLSHRPEPSGHAVHGEVDGLDIGGQHGRRFVLRHTRRPQRRPYPRSAERARLLLTLQWKNSCSSISTPPLTQAPYNVFLQNSADCEQSATCNGRHQW